MTIALRAAGTATGATAAVTAINPAVPSGATSTDVSILTVSVKPYSATVQTPNGWTKLGEATNGTVANGVDLGSTKVLMYYRIGASVGAIGNINQATANTMTAVIHTYSTTLGWWDLTGFTTGGDTTNGANYSATGAAGIGVASGDWVVAGTAINADLGTVSADTIAGMSGATLGTYAQRTNAATTTGNDNRLLVGDRPISSGSSSSAPTVTYTNASNTSGTTAWVRLREIATPTAKTPPTRTAGQWVSGSTTTTPKTSAAFDVTSGDLVVVFAGASGPNVGFPATPTASGGSITWTLRQDHTNVAGYGDGRMWTGAVGATATGITIQMSTGGGYYFGFGVEVFSAHGGVGASAKDTLANTAASSAGITMTCTDQNSAIVYGNTDGWAQTGTTTWRTVRDTAMTEEGKDQVTSQYGVYMGYKADAGYLSGHTVGLFAPLNQQPAMIAVEILGVSGGAAQQFDPTAIASAETFGTPTATATLTASPGGIATGETFGTPVFTAGALTASPTGIGSAETFGTATAVPTLTASPGGIATAETFGLTVHAGALTAAPGGIPTDEAFGTPANKQDVTYAPSGITTSELIGAAVAVLVLVASPTGITSAEAFGTTTAVKTLTSTPTGIGSGEAFGTPVETGALTVSPSAIPTGEAFGTPGAFIAWTYTPDGIGSLEGHGTPTFTPGAITCTPGGIGSAEAFGTATVNTGYIASPGGIASAEAFGTAAAQIDIIYTPGGIASAEAFGTPVRTSGGLTATPTGIGSAEALGTASAVKTLTASPGAVTSAESFGTPSVIKTLTSTPGGIASGQAFGTPAATVNYGALATGIPSGETFGAPVATIGQDLTRNLEFEVEPLVDRYVSEALPDKFDIDPLQDRYDVTGLARYTAEPLNERYAAEPL